MERKHSIGLLIAGIAAGAVNGLFGAGGGMVLVPLLSLLGGLDEQSLFPSSIAIILPLCIVTLTFAAFTTGVDWHRSVPYLIGSAAGGLLAGIYGQRIPAHWLHRCLGLLILWGGVRYLC